MGQREEVQVLCVRNFDSIIGMWQKCENVVDTSENVVCLSRPFGGETRKLETQILLQPTLRHDMYRSYRAYME